MAALIQHFGDTADGLRPCGHCDFCAPQNATAQTFRTPTTEEDRQLRAILRALDGQTRATGKLHTELSTSALRNTPAADRKIFDTLLDALTRSGLITLNTDQWTNPEGNLITFKKASLTHEGRTLTGPLPPDLLLKDTSATHIRFICEKNSRNSAGAKPSKASLKAEREQTTAAYTPEQKIPRSQPPRLAQSRSRQRPANPPSSSSATPSSTTSSSPPQNPLRTPHRLRHRPRKNRPLRGRNHRHLSRRSTHAKARGSFPSKGETEVSRHHK